MIFDIFVLIFVATAMFLGFKYGTHIELYRIGRVFLGMTIASMYGMSMGWKLTAMGIVSANTKAILSLIGFVVVFSIYWVISIIVVKIFARYELHNHKLNNYIGIFANGIITVIFISLTAFFSTQLSFAKDGYKAYLRDSSFSYIHMDRACRKAITAKVVDEITGDCASNIVIKNMAK